LNHNEKNKYLRRLIDEFSKSPLVNFLRLSYEEIPLISNFLIAVWSENYGRNAFPYFKEDYLRWVLGGPNKDRHILMGGKINNQLIAYQTLLYRTVSLCGNKLNAFLVTHLTISPKISLQERLHILAQKPVFDEQSLYYEPDCDLIYEFHEESSPLRDVSGRMLKKYYDLERKILCNFSQFMVVPKKLRNYMKQNCLEKDSSLVRAASESDCEELTKLFNQISEGLQFARMMTQEELRHHFFGHSKHLTSVIETEGKIRAFINFYPIEIIKKGQSSSYIVIEFVFSKERNRSCVAILLNEALKRAEEIGAKGVVFENATYLDPDYYQEVGLIPTFRRMTISVIPRSHAMDYLGGFWSDVK
jgi:N-acetylglutamate synthase-like GNAT family acetyltransferase